MQYIIYCSSSSSFGSTNSSSRGGSVKVLFEFNFFKFLVFSFSLLYFLKQQLLLVAAAGR
jgi:hypothetical protein